jgi:hypothetical protein
VKRLPIPKSADLDEEAAHPEFRMSWSGRSDDCSLVVARFLAKTYDRGKGRHYAMFVRFRETPYGLQVSLILTRREGGKARHEHIAGLGAITIPGSAADRIAFWRRLHDRLFLSNRIVDEQSKILDAVDERIPMPTPDELRDVQLENAKVD